MSKILFPNGRDLQHGRFVCIHLRFYSSIAIPALVVCAIAPGRTYPARQEHATNSNTFSAKMAQIFHKTQLKILESAKTASVLVEKRKGTTIDYG
ncbi:MAG: hypothetical protein RG741_08005 [Bacteroidales bacterium]|nr:hypothetical protein [Bacteroidales bacterium]